MYWRVILVLLAGKACFFDTDSTSHVRALCVGAITRKSMPQAAMAANVRDPSFSQVQNMQSHFQETCMELSLDREEDGGALIPLSRNPILLVSSQPLLTQDQCSILKRHFRVEPSQEGKVLLETVQKHIDKLTACPSHKGEAVLPRFVFYKPESLSNSPLLPDGLHVDTNNGYYFRHITVLLYLTTNDNGATTFPLAIPMKKRSEGTVDDLLNAAQILLDSGITHTFDESHSKEHQELSKSLELAAKQLYDDGSDCDHGLRVLPRAGTVCIFSNVLENGRADPYSFHGGEAGNDKEKALLTFFKEIPVESFSGQQEFGQRVAVTRKYLLNTYYSETDQMTVVAPPN